MNEENLELPIKPKRLFLKWLLVLIFLIVLGLVFVFLRPKSEIRIDKSSDDRVNSKTISGKRSMSEPVFSAKIFDQAQVAYITPLGELNGGYEESSTIAGVMINNKDANEIPVYAPTKMTLDSYSYHVLETEPPNWALDFKIDDETSINFHHLSTAVSKIVEVTTDTPKLNDSRTNPPKKKITFEAGELIATTSGTSKAHNWNIYLYNQNTKNAFTNQARYEKDSSSVGQRLITGKCPFDYYDASVKQEFLALMGYSAPGQSADCGSISSDVAGTLSGMWHFQAENVGNDYDGAYANPFSIYMTSDKTIVLADINKIQPRLASKNSTYKDPALVTDSHCYNLTDSSNRAIGFAYFKIVSATEMQMSYGNNTCPAEFPATGAKTYYR